MYDKLAAKVNNVDTSDFVLKTKYQTDKTELERKIPDVTDFVKKTKLDTLQLKKLMIVKIFEVKILCIYLLIMQVDILKKKEINT